MNEDDSTPTPAAGESNLEKERRQYAEKSLANSVYGGIGLVVLGGIILGAGWPTATVTAFGVDESGSPWAVAIGSLICWAGTALVGMAVIGYGVRLGNEATRRHPG